MTAKPRPNWAAARVPRALSPVTRQTIALVIRPPSSGKAGTRLNPRINTFINRSQLSDSNTGVMRID